MNRETLFSPCRQYRYTLWRKLQGESLVDKPSGTVNFLMLNPSTADETQDDPTIRRCIGFATAWGYAELVVTNIFAYRATDPTVMKDQADPIGPENDQHIIRTARESQLVVAAWGAHGKHLDRGHAVRKMLDSIAMPLNCLKTIAQNQPSHPLYLPAALLPKPYPFSKPTSMFTRNADYFNRMKARRS